MRKTGPFAVLLLLTAMTGWTLDGNVRDTVTEPFPGIRILEREMISPPQRIFAAFISVDEPSLRIDATEPTQERVSVKDWAEARGALVATNGDFPVQDRHVDRLGGGVHFLYGDAVGGGQRWPEKWTGRYPGYSHMWFWRNYGWIALGPDGPQFCHTQWIKANPHTYRPRDGWRPDEITSEIPENVHALVSGFPQLVVEGRPLVCDVPTERRCFPDRVDMMARHPRTAMGLTEDMKTFILVVVDGRSDEAVGMYGSELAELMHDLGAWVAINLDGGGSSQMYVKGRGVINQPWRRAGETADRPVLSHWGVFPAGESESSSISP